MPPDVSVRGKRRTLPEADVEGLTLEQRVEELAAEVEKLKGRIDTLADGMVTVVTEAVPAERSPEAEKSVGQSDGIAAWAGSSALLPRVSTLCFLLVVALALRTVTDSGILEKHVGSLVGMVYAASIMAAGWIGYRKGSPIAPVFSLSGALLMFSIVIETHTRFGSLSTLPAYGLLIATGMTMALTGRAATSRTPMFVGILGMCLAGVALNFPVPSLPYLAVLLFTANAAAYRGAGLVKRDWLRWFVFALTALAVQIWGVRLQGALVNPDVPGPDLNLTWYIPVTVLFALFFFITSIRGMLRSAEAGQRVFDYVIPALSAFVFFTAARHVALPLWQNGIVLGVAGVAAATAYLGIASWMVRREDLGAAEFNSFTFAAVVWLVLALSAATGALLAALPFISIAALHLATISDRWQSGGTRVISYLMQAFTALALSAMLLAGQGQVSPLLAGAATGAVAVSSLFHFRWCRRHDPPPDSYVFSKLDSRDYSGVTTLLASLAGWFFLLRLGAYEFLRVLPGVSDSGNAYSGAQSLLINSAAIALFIISYLRRNRELRNVAIFITFVGAGKVFLYDLVGVEGLSRVFSVFSFGIVAAVASYILSRWQKVQGPSTTGGEPAPLHEEARKA